MWVLWAGELKQKYDKDIETSIIGILIWNNSKVANNPQNIVFDLVYVVVEARMVFGFTSRD
jgi:hypothetical protein